MQSLFGVEVPFDQIVSCRVNRLRVDVRGIQTAVARVALGGQRTQVWLTLADGRELTSLARDDPAQAQALEQFIDRLELDRVQRWRATLARGETVQVGKVSMTREHLAMGKKKLPWSSVGGYSFREGALMVDGPNHRLVFQLWVAAAPWAGAIARMLEAMAPGRDYERVPPESLPRMGFFATSALTHVPGAMTMRARGYLLLGIFGGGGVAAAVGGLIYFAWMGAEQARMREYWMESMQKDTAAMVAHLDDAAFRALAPCEPKAYGRNVDYLVAARPLESSVELTEGGSPISELRTYPDQLLVWTRAGDELRGVLDEDRLKDDPLCRVTASGSDMKALLAELNKKP